MNRSRKRWIALQRIVDRKLQAPLIPLNYRRDLLNIQREVRRLFHEFNTAKTQLASVMGVSPRTSFDLVMPSSAISVPTINLDSQTMEEQALLLRPELRAIDYKKRITHESVI